MTKFVMSVLCDLGLERILAQAPHGVPHLHLGQEPRHVAEVTEHLLNTRSKGWKYHHRIVFSTCGLGMALMDIVAVAECL